MGIRLALSKYTVSGVALDKAGGRSFWSWHMANNS